MEQLGEVKAILNEDMLLISSSEDLRIDKVITVFTLVKDDQLAEATGTKQIVIPKGELRIVCKQSGDIYLAERFREFSERRSKISVPSPLMKALSSVSAQFGAESREVVERVPGPWSAELDQEQSLKISPSKIVIVGDLIGRK